MKLEERKTFRQAPARAGLVLLLTLLLSACGGDTSVYFCSGSEEFCSGVRDRDDDEDQTATAAAQALTLARTTPEVIEAGLEVDGLKTVALEAPDTVGGWLLLTSLGVLADDGDNAAVSGFFDRVRVWLAAERPGASRDPVLAAGMGLLAEIARERDPAVAEQLQLEDAKGAFTPAFAGSIARERPGAEHLTTLDTAGECCSARTLATASLVLCATLPEESAPQVNQACAVADRWLDELRVP